MLRILAIIWTCLIIISVILVTRRKIKTPDKKKEDPPNLETELSNEINGSVSPISEASTVPENKIYGLMRIIEFK